MTREIKMKMIDAVRTGKLRPHETEVKHLVLNYPEGSENEPSLVALMQKTEELNERRAVLGLPLDNIVLILMEQD